MASSMGQIQCKTAIMGSDENFTVVANGVANFPLGDPTFAANKEYPDVGLTVWNANSGLNMSNVTTPTEGFSRVENWLDTYMLGAPPAVTANSNVATAASITLTWTNPTQKKLAFLTTYVPQISSLRADIVPALAGGADNFPNLATQGFTITMETPSTGKPTATSLRLYQDINAGTNNLTSGVYNYYGNASARVLQGQAYDVRVYPINDATSNGSRAINYTYFSNVSLLTTGPPGAPTSFAVGSLTTTTGAATWTAPSVRDTLTGSTPFISQYQVNVTATSGPRYPTFLSNQSTAQTTSVASGSDATTSLTLSLNPGTTYNGNVAARNAANTSFGTASANATFTTSYPTAPGFLANATTTSISNQSSLIYASNTSGSGYTLDGSTVRTPILRSSLINTTAPRTGNLTNIRLNYTVGDTSANIGTISGLGGVQGSEATGTVTTVGFGQTFTTPSYGNATGVSLVVAAEGDVYTASGPSGGFYKQATVFVQAANVSSVYVPSTGAYNMYAQFAPIGGTTTRTANLLFYVDGIDTLPSVVQSGITSATTATQQITGVPTYTSSASFSYRTTISNLVGQFLRYDQVHYAGVIQTSGGTALTSNVSIGKASINGTSTFYYSAPTPSYAVSTTLHNTSGTVLSVNAPNIQFNNFSLTLNAAANVFDEGVVLKITPFNMLGSGTATTTGYVSSSDGSTGSIRIDTKSVNVLANLTGANGVLMNPGSGQYPTTGYTSTYSDHSASIVATEQLQLVNGRWSTPGVGDGYRNYASYYFPGSLSLYDYTAISSSGYRYVTLRFNNLRASTTYNYIQITATTSGLTMTPSSDSANFRLYAKIVDSTNSFTSPWVSCTVSINAVGWSSITSDGQGIMDNSVSNITGTSLSIKAFTPTATSASAIIYLRIGLDMSAAQAISAVSVTAP